jgi:hypothetical protein
MCRHAPSGGLHYKIIAGNRLFHGNTPLPAAKIRRASFVPFKDGYAETMKNFLAQKP